MGKLDYYNETQSNSGHALDRAKEAAKVANVGYLHKQRYEEAEAALTWWRRIMISSPVTLHNSLFAIFLIADLILSWDIFKTVVEEAGVFADSPLLVKIATLILCLLISGWAIMTAHFIGKGWASDVQAWERWNHIFMKKVQAPTSIIDEYMDKEFRRARRLAVLSGVLLLAVVIITAYFRNAVTQLGEEGGEVVPFMGLTLIGLPIAVILGELFTGDYVWYTLCLLGMRRQRQVEYEKFVSYKNTCSRLDTEAVEYASKARRLNEPLEVSEDLERSQMRHRFRSAQDDSYLDPYFGKIAFTIRTNDRKPAADLSIFGILPNGAKTGDFCTDKNGKVVLYWSGDWDHLVSVRVEGKDYLGPFQAHSEHFIDLPDPVLEHTPCAKPDSHLM